MFSDRQPSIRQRLVVVVFYDSGETGGRQIAGKSGLPDDRSNLFAGHEFLFQAVRPISYRLAFQRDRHRHFAMAHNTKVK